VDRTAPTTRTCAGRPDLLPLLCVRRASAAGGSGQLPKRGLPNSLHPGILRLSSGNAPTLGVAERQTPRRFSGCYASGNRNIAPVGQGSPSPAGNWSERRWTCKRPSAFFLLKRWVAETSYATARLRRSARSCASRRRADETTEGDRDNSVPFSLWRGNASLCMLSAYTTRSWVTCIERPHISWAPRLIGGDDGRLQLPSRPPSVRWRVGT
jgi:hypothetical protein